MKNKKELAEIINLSIPTIDKLMTQGMPHFKIGKSVRFDVDAVLKWIEENFKVES